MSAEPALSAHRRPALGRLGCLRSLVRMLGRLRRVLPSRPRADKSLEALAAIEDDDLCSLSETGLRLRREARQRRAARQRTYAAWLSAGVSVLISATQVIAQQVCSPALTIKQFQLSDVQEPTAERKWTALVLVDASHCAPNSGGSFQLVLSRLKENAPETQFRERFLWLPPAVIVELSFWADEAVERSWIENITPCTCAR